MASLVTALPRLANSFFTTIEQHLVIRVMGHLSTVDIKTLREVVGGDAAHRMRKLRGCSQMRSLLKALDARRPDDQSGTIRKVA
jgi:hypothetical protein